jgi:hypothetical protein
MSLDNLGLLFIAIILLISGFMGMFYADGHARVSQSLLRAFRMPEDFIRLTCDADGTRFTGRVAFGLGMVVLIVGIIRNFA